MSDATSGRYIQYGCGTCSPAGWENYDCSPTLRLGRIPLVGRLIKSPFPSTVIYGDIVRGLGIPDGCAKAVYASHVLEHLSRADCGTALRNTFRMLERGGRFRLIVPDLKARASVYLQSAATGDANAAHVFMHTSSLGVEPASRGWAARARRAFGNSAHLWMWDEVSMTHALKESGFTDIRRCAFGDSGDEMFQKVEALGSFADQNWNDLPNCAMEAVRPL